ncbi:MAG: PTS mannitol transporter subunit IICBA [Clostridiales bacterium]|jgi:PTS system mannitol-specific IIC component|nr:PTS mannitol transporter subunit IICBA [Clostridiales bacterium]
MSNTQQKIQSFGRTLSAMVMPNIGAFIAWGLITAFFIGTGWLPNERLAGLVDPMIKYLLPLLIGYTGGKNVYGVRGGVLGAIATIGVIVGAEIPMFLGAMLMGPLGGYIIKKFDEAVEGKIPSGFEMLVNNFSAGIIGMIITILGFLFIGPVITTLTGVVNTGVNAVVTMGLLPIVSIIVEPAKVLFLNNALNHGIFGPLGAEQVATAGKSIFFLIETNPGPGLGILLAYMFFGKGNAKQSAPGAAIIHFFGGIHEVYFPYVLMNPLLLIAAIAGGASGVLVNGILGAGLSATPSPGSILALLAVAPPGEHIKVLISVAVSAAVAFFVAAIFVKTAKNDGDSLESAQEKTTQMKLESKNISPNNNTDVLKGKEVKVIVYACDAGMGSSAMGAANLQRKLKSLGYNLTVKNYAIDNIPANADVVVSHEQLTQRARAKAPSAYHISITDFLDSSVVETVKGLVDSKSAGKKTLTKDNILLNLPSEPKTQAIKRCGNVLIKNGYAKEGYDLSMLKREETVSTYLGKGLSMPHCTSEGRGLVITSGISILLYPDGVDYGSEKAYILFGVAGKGDEHLEIIAKLAEILDTRSTEQIKEIASAKDAKTILDLFSEV